MDYTKEQQETMSMTADTIGKNILQTLVQEINLIPDVWPKLSKAKQNDVIERLREMVIMNVQMAVHLIASEGRVVVDGTLDQITIKDTVKAVITINRSSGSLPDLYETTGEPVLIIVKGGNSHCAGANDVVGEDDQRAMDLGHEYDKKPTGTALKPVK